MDTLKVIERRAFYLFSALGGALLVYKNMGLVFIPILIVLIIGEVLFKKRNSISIWESKRKGLAYGYCILIIIAVTLISMNIYINGKAASVLSNDFELGLTELTISFLVLMLTQVSFFKRGRE